MPPELLVFALMKIGCPFHCGLGVGGGGAANISGCALHVPDRKCVGCL